MVDLPTQEHRHRRGLRAGPLDPQRGRVGLRHRPVRAAARDRVARGRHAVRPRPRRRRRDPADRRARTRHDDARRRRGPAVQRGPRLRPAPPDPPGDPGGAARPAPRPRWSSPWSTRRSPRRATRTRCWSTTGTCWSRSWRARKRGSTAPCAPACACSRRRATRSSRRASTVFPGDVAFNLHDTHGFPIELTEEIAGESGLSVDRAAFDEAMAAQRERARRSTKLVAAADDAHYRDLVERHGTTEFVGRDVARYSVETASAGPARGRRRDRGLPGARRRSTPRAAGRSATPGRSPPRPGASTWPTPRASRAG